MFDSTVKLKQIIQFYPTVQSESNLYNGTMQEATNSTIGAIRPCVNGTVEHEHLNTVSLWFDERKTLTKVSTRTTSHKHSPKQAQASDTKEQENQQTRQKASCIARGENQF